MGSRGERFSAYLLCAVVTSMFSFFAEMRVLPSGNLVYLLISEFYVCVHFFTAIMQFFLGVKEGAIILHFTLRIWVTTLTVKCKRKRA